MVGGPPLLSSLPIWGTQKLARGLLLPEVGQRASSAIIIAITVTHLGNPEVGQRAASFIPAHLGNPEVGQGVFFWIPQMGNPEVSQGAASYPSFTAACHVALSAHCILL